MTWVRTDLYIKNIKIFIIIFFTKKKFIIRNHPLIGYKNHQLPLSEIQHYFRNWIGVQSDQGIRLLVYWSNHIVTS